MLSAILATMLAATLAVKAAILSAMLTTTLSGMSPARFTLNVWDVGGQSSLRSYWRNYFESTDGVVWVVDSGDRQRLQLCATELRALLDRKSVV